MKSICIILSANTERKALYAEQTVILAKVLVYNDYHAVYGGANVGLMGVLARTGLVPSTRVPTVSPAASTILSGQNRMVASIEAKNVAERTRRLLELADTYIAQPGGYSTPREVRALLALAQIGLCHRSIAFFTMADYHRQLELFIDRAAAAGFIREKDKHLLAVERRIEELLKGIREFKPSIWENLQA